MVFNQILSSAKDQPRQHGGALVEFAIALPICLLVIFGVFEIGRLLAQYSWVQQTSYNSAFLGSGFTLTSPQTDPNYVAATLYNKSNIVAKNAMQQSPSIDVNNTTSSSISVRIDGDLNLLTNLYPLDIDVTSYSIKFTQNVVPGSTVYFENFSDSSGPTFFNCDGSPCGNNSACSADVCP